MTEEWDNWRNFVLEELKRLNSGQVAINEALVTVRVEIAMLKVKAGVWGALGGLCSVVGLLIIEAMKK